VLFRSSCEVIQAQWFAVMKMRPWTTPQVKNSGWDGVVKEGPEYAANWISWADATEFCNVLSKLTGKRVRLPTEAEWEYACRAGTSTSFNFGEDDLEGTKLRDYAWFAANAEDANAKYAHMCGQKRPNAWGLYDMHGNVAEWCSDWYDANYYSVGPGLDPHGPPEGSKRVLRGGSWYIQAVACKSGARFPFDPHVRSFYSGLRVVVETDRPSESRPAKRPGVPVQRPLCGGSSAVVAVR
jgi:formylglycine-generating enzyme required for sulfatase activity